MQTLAKEALRCLIKMPQPFYQRMIYDRYITSGFLFLTFAEH